MRTHALKLQSVPLFGRNFLMQGFAIEAEFGGVIPWLEGFGELLYVQHIPTFVARLQELTQQDAPLTAYQFVTEDTHSDYLGGILHFERHPERFVDTRNVDFAEQLTAAGVSFISCLHVRPPYRGLGIGDPMMRRALSAIHAAHGSVWGVVSDPRLIPWHMSMGAQLLSPVDNRDNLWIMQWSEDRT